MHHAGATVDDNSAVPDWCPPDLEPCQMTLLTSLLLSIGCSLVSGLDSADGVEEDTGPAAECIVDIPEDATSPSSQSFGDGPYVVCSGDSVTAYVGANYYMLGGSLNPSGGNVWASSRASVDADDEVNLVYETGAEIGGPSNYASARLCPVLVFRGAESHCGDE